MATSSKQFWGDRQNAALFKHGALERYLKTFAMITGTRRGEVHYIDGYAGPGSYDTGEPGSPKIALDIARDLFALRALQGTFIEEQAAQARRLEGLVERTSSADRWQVLQGSCEDHLPEVLENVGDAPLLVFLDPYGLGIPFRTLVDHVLNRSAGARGRRITEVIVHFSIAAMNRLGGFLEKRDPDSPLWTAEPEEVRGRTPEARIAQARQITELMDGFLGGAWWHTYRRPKQSTWPHQVMVEWQRLVLKEAAGSWQPPTTIAVPQTWNGKPAYYLVHFTQHPLGVEKFCEATSHAYSELYARTYAIEPDPGQLFAPEDLPVPDFNELLSGKLTSHIRSLVKTGFEGAVRDHFHTVCGDLLGQVRDRHLRAALHALVTEGAIEGPAPTTAELRQFVVRPARA